jgi:branched-chain amino acid transport system permease protein
LTSILRVGPARDAALLVLLLAIITPLLDDFRVLTLGSYLPFAMLALSLALVWGQCGILSFGQGAFFSIGAYAVAIGINRWGALYGLVAGVLLGIAIAGALAVVLGRFMFARSTEAFYPALITLALAVVFQQLVLQFPAVTGGYNGVLIQQTIWPQEVRAGYYLMLGVFALVLAPLVVLVRSDFGRAVVAVRDNEERTRFLGYRSNSIRTGIFALGAALAALAGVLYALNTQSVSPDNAGFDFSTEVLIWVAVGGRAYLVGAALGALIVNIGQQELSGVLVFYWRLLIGLGFIASVLFFPDGLYSIVLRAGRRFTRRESMRLVVAQAQPLWTAHTTKGPLLTADGVGMSFGRLRAVRDVGLELRAGELRSLIGPNGAGKSTLVSVLSGGLSTAHGKASVLGQGILGQTPEQIAALGLRRKFQSASVFETLSVADNLFLGASRGRISARSLVLRSHEVILAPQVLELAREGGLLERLQEPAGRLGHGDRQWLELCMILAGEPILVLLDEPTAGLTSQERRRIGVSLRGLVAEGLSVLLIEHDFDFVRDVADRITVMNQGAIVADGSVSDVSADPVVRGIYLGAVGA